MQTRQCSICGNDFDVTPPENSEKFYKNYRSYCTACNTQKAKEWRAKNRGYKSSGKVTSIPKEDRLLMSAIRQRIVDAKLRCKKLKRGEVTVNDLYLYELFLKQNRQCALTGATLSFEKNHPLCLSLDQIDGSKGYIEGNVQWLAWCVNRAKGDLSLDHFFEMCHVVVNRQKVQRLSQ
jgi:hypothetical protein